MQSIRNKNRIKRAEWLLAFVFTGFLFLILQLAGFIFINVFPHIEKYYFEKELNQISDNYINEINKGNQNTGYKIINKGDYFVYYPEGNNGKVSVQKGFLNHKEAFDQLILKSKFSSIAENELGFFNNLIFINGNIKEKFTIDGETMATLDKKFFEEYSFDKNVQGIKAYLLEGKKIYVFNKSLKVESLSGNVEYQAVMPSLISGKAMRTFIYYYQLIIVIISILTVTIYYFSAKRIINPIREANEKIKSFADNAGHEIMSPLTVISGQIQMGQMGKKVNFEKVKSNIDKITEVIGTIKKISFLERNQFEIKKQNISELIKEFLGNKECSEILLKLRSDLKINLNKDLLFLILENLYGNAIKYKEKNSKLKIEVSEKGINFENKATKTLSNEEISKLTQRFYQADNSRMSSGTGLGLAMVDEAVKILGWKVRFESKDKVFTAKIRW